MAIQFHNVKIKLCFHCNWDFMNFILTCRNIFCSLAHFLFPCTFLNNFFLFRAFLELDSTPTTATTTKLLLGPLSIACGQKCQLFHSFLKGYFNHVTIHPGKFSLYFSKDFSGFFILLVTPNAIQMLANLASFIQFKTGPCHSSQSCLFLSQFFGKVGK